MNTIIIVLLLFLSMNVFAQQQQAKPAEQAEQLVQIELPEISEEQKKYNFCVMQKSLLNVNQTKQCVSIVLAKFIQEHGQEVYEATTVEEIGKYCFHSGAKVQEVLLENCKYDNGDSSPTNDDQQKQK